jgi:hypothetical protein
MMTSEQVYAETIGEEFIEVRGAGFDLSALDRELIAKWFGEGVPLHLPVNALAVVAERFRQAGRARVRSLAYIQEEVEAGFAELLEGHVGCGGCDRPYCAGREAQVA